MSGTEDSWNPKSPDAALQVLELAGVNAKVKNSPSLLVMGKTILTSKIQMAVLSAKALGCLNFPISPRNPAVRSLQTGLLMCPAVPAS